MDSLTLHCPAEQTLNCLACAASCLLPQDAGETGAEPGLAPGTCEGPEPCTHRGRAGTIALFPLVFTLSRQLHLFAF